MISTADFPQSNYCFALFIAIVLLQPTLESVNVADVFAAGDVSYMPDHPRPKAGVFAVRAGCVSLKL